MKGVRGKSAVLVWGMVLACMFLAGCGCASAQDQLSRSMEIRLPDSAEVEMSDSHEGFHGDGMTTAKAQFSEDEFEDVLKEIEASENWKNTPMSENLRIFLYGGQKNGVVYAFNIADMADIPEITQGYYLFRNDADAKTPVYDDKDLLKQLSFNVTCAILDTDTKTLYYIQYDT